MLAGELGGLWLQAQRGMELSRRLCSAWAPPRLGGEHQKHLGPLGPFSSGLPPGGSEAESLPGARGRWGGLGTL